MSTSPGTNGLQLDLGRVARWRSVLEVVAAILLVGTAVSMAGSVTAALTTDPEFSTGWSRVSQFSYLVASFWYVALTASSVALVLSLRLLFTWPASTRARMAWSVLALAEVLAAAIVVACLLGVIALFADTEYLDTRTSDQISGVLLFGGTGIASAGVGIMAAMGLSSLGAPSPAVQGSVSAGAG